MAGSFISKINRHRGLYLMLLPGLAYFIIFRYVPMWGAVIAFQNYQPFLDISGSSWVGFAHFKSFFSNPEFLILLRNTLMITAYNLVFFFPMPIIMALLLNELKSPLYKKVVQTAVYVPYFISIVIVVSITYVFFTTEGGMFNEFLLSIGAEKIAFLEEPEWFRPMIVGQIIWKDTGWGTIIFLAALAGVDPQLYEAATVDGAGRFRQLWHITLPAIRSTIIILLILRMGSVLDTGFEQILLMVNPMNRSVGEVFDTFVYRIGILGGAFSYSTAVGLFKALVGIVMIWTANSLARKASETSLF